MAQSEEGEPHDPKEDESDFDDDPNDDPKLCSSQ